MQLRQCQGQGGAELRGCSAGAPKRPHLLRVARRVPLRLLRVAGRVALLVLRVALLRLLLLLLRRRHGYREAGSPGGRPAGGPGLPLRWQAAIAHLRAHKSPQGSGSCSSSCCGRLGRQLRGCAAHLGWLRLTGRPGLAAPCCC
jgi:hypothetical protein